MKIEHIIPLTCLGFTTISSLQISMFGTALPLIVAELNINYSLIGILMALWTFATFIAPLTIGRYVDKLNPLTVIVIVMLVSLFSSLLTAFSRNLIELNTARLLLSFSLPFVWPTCAKIVTVYTSSRSYGYSTAVFNFGSMAGMALSYIVVALVGGSSWRVAVIVAGLPVLIYIPIVIAIWNAVIRGGTEIKGSIFRQDQQVDVRHPNIIQKDIVKIAIQLFLAHFCAVYTWSLLINWLSTFLINELKFSYNYIAIYMFLIATISGILEVSAGTYSDRIGGLRGRLMILYVGLVSSSILLLSTVLTTSSSLIIMSLASLSILMWRISTPSFWSIISDAIPLNYIGKISRIYVSAVPLAGITSSIVNGYVVSATGSVKYGVIISSILLLLSPLLYTFAARIGYRYKNHLDGKVGIR
ncbi:MAG: MFS transporter [Ignisphaera sp.]